MTPRALLILPALILLGSVALAQATAPASVNQVGVAAAFLAGLVSFLSPCVLPLVPSYLAVLGGGAGKKPVRGALLFILGFSIMFIGTGAAASALGSLLAANEVILTRIGGALILVFGVIFLVKDRVPFLTQEYRAADLGTASRFGLVALGAAFAVGWTPCIGPILGAIYSIAARTADVGQGVGLLAAYSIGLGIPFLLAALAWDRVSAGMRRAGRWVNAVEKVSGVLLIAAGVLLLTDQFTRFNGFFEQFTPGWLRQLL